MMHLINPLNDLDESQYAIFDNGNTFQREFYVSGEKKAQMSHEVIDIKGLYCPPDNPFYIFFKHRVPWKPRAFVAGNPLHLPDYLLAHSISELRAEVSKRDAATESLTQEIHQVRQINAVQAETIIRLRQRLANVMVERVIGILEECKQEQWMLEELAPEIKQLTKMLFRK